MGWGAYMLARVEARVGGSQGRAGFPRPGLGSEAQGQQAAGVGRGSRPGSIQGIAPLAWPGAPRHAPPSWLASRNAHRWSLPMVVARRAGGGGELEVHSFPGLLPAKPRWPSQAPPAKPSPAAADRSAQRATSNLVSAVARTPSLPFSRRDVDVSLTRPRQHMPGD